MGQRVGELGEQVVVAEHAQPPLAPVELGADRPGEGHPVSGGAVTEHVVSGGLEPGLRVTGRRPGQPQSLGVAERRRLCSGAEVLEEQVVDHLTEEVLEVLHESGVGVGVTGDAEAAEHQVAELVGGGDGGAVEGPERRPQPLSALGPLLGRGVEEQGEEVGVGVGAIGVGKGALGVDELGADPLAQLLAGGPAEGDDQHLLQRGDALGDEAGHERPDRPGLAGARARLEQRGAGGQWAADVEDLLLS